MTMDLLGLVYFLEIFRSYLEGSEFEMITDNQVLKHLFSNPYLSIRQARWPEFLCQFGITNLILEKCKVHVFCDTLPLARNEDNMEFNNVHIFQIELPSTKKFYKTSRLVLFVMPFMEHFPKTVASEIALID